jgi:type IV pilus assembly protein PilX
VLFVALVFLILITLLALTATGTSILQEKMTGGMRNRQLSLMGAESALRGGEAFFTTANFSGSNPLPQCSVGPSGVCAYPRRPTFSPATGTASTQIDPVIQNFRSSASWIAGPGGAPTYTHALTGLTGGGTETASLHAQPLFTIEDLGADVPGSNGRQSQWRDPASQKSAWLYRITARSQGGSGAVIRVVESVYSPGLNLGNAGANTGP